MTVLLLLASLAFGQDTADTGEPADTDEVEDTGDTAEPLLEMPAGTTIMFPDETEVRMGVPTLGLPLEPPDLARGISKLPRGSYIVVLEDDGTLTPHRIPEKYWLMPDTYYREAVTKAKQLEIYESALGRCTERALAWQEKTYEAQDACLDQFDSDEGLIASQVQAIATWEAKALTYKGQRDNARRQRNVAWAVTGGLILGATAVTVVAIAP